MVSISVGNQIYYFLIVFVSLSIICLSIQSVSQFSSVCSVSLSVSQSVILSSVILSVCLSFSLSVNSVYQSVNYLSEILVSYEILCTQILSSFSINMQLNTVDKVHSVKTISYCCYISVTNRCSTYFSTVLQCQLIIIRRLTGRHRLYSVLKKGCMLAP